MTKSSDTTPGTVYITQAQIDELIRNAAPPAIELILEPEAATGSESAQDVISQEDLDWLLHEIEPDSNSTPPVSEPSVDSELGLISQEDIDRLLSGIDADSELEEEPEAAEQAPRDLSLPEDIDQLLSGADKPPVPEKKSDEFFLQEDIDALFGAVPKASVRDQAVLTAEDADTLFSDNDADQDQEVWHDLDDSSEPAHAMNKTAFEGGKRRRWYFGKALLITACLFGLVLSSVVWLKGFYAGLRSAATTATVVTFPIVMPPAVGKLVLPPTPAAAKPEMVALSSFLVPTPIQWKDTGYIRADIDLEFRDSKGAAEVKKNEPFFRFLIYRILIKIAVSSDRKTLDAASLGPMIQDALNRSLARQPIRKVVVKRFEVI